MFAVLPSDNLYQLLLFLHIGAAIVGFGSTFVWPFLAARARQSGDPAVMLQVSRISMDGGRTLTEGPIYAVGVTGLVLVIFGATADPSYWSFSDTWVSIAMTLYIAGLVLSLAFHQPNLKRMLALQEEMAAGPPPQGGPPPQVAELQVRGKKAAMFGGILHLIFVLVLLDMVFKPWM